LIGVAVFPPAGAASTGDTPGPNATNTAVDRAAAFLKIVDAFNVIDICSSIVNVGRAPHVSDESRGRLFQQFDDQIKGA
jgi:hypothetical protein